MVGGEDPQTLNTSDDAFPKKYGNTNFRDLSMDSLLLVVLFLNFFEYLFRNSDPGFHHDGTETHISTMWCALSSTKHSLDELFLHGATPSS